MRRHVLVSVLPAAAVLFVAGESRADEPAPDPSPEVPIRPVDAPIATDPPTNWAVVHAGFKPRLGTFGGVATFALA
jgi:hypothetical protein